MSPEQRLELTNRQSWLERLAEHSAWVLIAVLAGMASASWWADPQSALNPPPLVLGGLPVLSAIWNTLYGAFAVLVPLNIARNRRRWEFYGHVCLVTAVAIHAAAALVFGLVEGDVARSIVVDLVAAAASYARMWVLRRPLRAELRSIGPDEDGSKPPKYGSHADRSTRAGGGAEAEADES